MAIPLVLSAAYVTICLRHTSPGDRHYVGYGKSLTTTIIYALSNNIPVFDIICKRSLNFIKNCLASNNDVVNFIARCGVHSSRMFLCIVVMVSFDLTNVQ